MKLYYCFNGLCDYEFEVNVADVMDAIRVKLRIMIEEEAVNFYFTNYNDMIAEYFSRQAYWDFLQTTKCDFLDERLMKKYRRAIREENKMLYGKNCV